MYDSEQDGQGDKWTLLEPLGGKQIGDRVGLGDALLLRQWHGLVIRDESAWAIRVGGLESDASWVEGHAESDRQLTTRLGVDMPPSPLQREWKSGITEDHRGREDLVDRR